MKIFPEFYDMNQFTLAQENVFAIKRPYINFAKTLKFKYQDYNSNIKLQCVHWNRLLMTCINQYGYFDMMKEIKCQEIVEYFHQCLQLNAFFGYHKKYFPNEYYYDKYWRVNPHYDEVWKGVQ